MIDIITGANGFIGKRLMQKIGSGAIAVPHASIFETAFPNCDRFFFLSTYGNMAGQSDIHETLQANVGQLGYALGSYIDGSYIEESKCESFVFVSSSSVNLPVQTPYSHAKRAGEEMVLASGIPACIVRPYSVTGVGEQPEHLIPTLIRSCMDRERVVLNPDPTHDFIDVEDIVNGLIMMADKKVTGLIELGHGNAYSNLQVLRLVEYICGKKANVSMTEKPVRDYDTKDWFCMNFRASQFGWLPQKNLTDSITEMVAAYKFKRK